MTSRKLPIITLKQFHKYLGRYVRQNRSSTRVIPATKRLRAPTEEGAGLFLYPAGSLQKKEAFATGPLGETSEIIHLSKAHISRSLGHNAPQVSLWGDGGASRVARNLISGVTDGFAISLELHGVGYRAEADPRRGVLVLRLGLSHTEEVPLQHGNTFVRALTPNLVQVAGVNRAHVHQTAAGIRDLRKPEPYKGKGIRYRSEPVRRKEARKS